MKQRQNDQVFVKKVETQTPVGQEGNFRIWEINDLSMDARKKLTNLSNLQIIEKEFGVSISVKGAFIRNPLPLKQKLHLRIEGPNPQIFDRVIEALIRLYDKPSQLVDMVLDDDVFPFTQQPPQNQERIYVSQPAPMMNGILGPGPYTYQEGIFGSPRILTNQNVAPPSPFYQFSSQPGILPIQIIPQIPQDFVNATPQPLIYPPSFVNVNSPHPSLHLVPGPSIYPIQQPQSHFPYQSNYGQQ